MAWLREHWLSTLVTVGIFAGLGLSVQQSNDSKSTSARLDDAIVQYNHDRTAAAAASCVRGDDVRAYTRLDASKNASEPAARRAVADAAFPLHDCTTRSDGKFPELDAKATAVKLATFKARYDP